ncbi:MAG: hypothetical protein AAGA54_05750 [Myxococcota bacterium]
MSVPAPTPTVGVPENDDPFAMLADAGGPLFLLALLIPVAVMVFFVGSRRVSKVRGTSALRPRGRVLLDAPRKRSDRWRATVKRLEAAEPTAADALEAGPVRLQGILTTASENLGGVPGRECVWRNRAGASAASAVGAEMVLLQDDTGSVSIEDLERAYVIAPAEKHTFHHENVSLYLGDRVEVFGHATLEPPTGAESTPRDRVYGTLTFADGLDIRLLDRPVPTPEPEDEVPDDTATESAQP